VNSQTYTVEVGSTVATLLHDFGIVPTHVVVQLDGMIISRDSYGKTELRHGSRLAIVTLVGGG
jgi:thiamine biosynthesis protein ThiS